jgi:hypothetical protein
VLKRVCLFAAAVASNAAAPLCWVVPPNRAPITAKHSQSVQLPSATPWLLQCCYPPCTVPGSACIYSCTRMSKSAQHPFQQRRIHSFKVPADAGVVLPGTSMKCAVQQATCDTVEHTASCFTLNHLYKMALRSHSLTHSLTKNNALTCSRCLQMLLSRPCACCRVHTGPCPDPSTDMLPQQKHTLPTSLHTICQVT